MSDAPTQASLAQHQNESDIVRQFHEGSLDRRTAVARLLTTGLSGPACYVALGLSSPSARAAEVPTSPAEIAAKMAALTKFLTSPEVLAAVKSPKSVDEMVSSITRAAATQKIVEAAGLDPKELRMSLRIFASDKGRELTLARVYASDKTSLIVKFDSPATQPPTEDKIREVLNHPKTGIRPNGGICVSYGKDWCVSGGVP